MFSPGQFYTGFFITDAVGNNHFSFEKRLNKQIFVPALIEGNPDNLEAGNEIVFSEIEDNKEINCRGLKHFIYWKKRDKEIFIFDNHNHAFFFWAYGLYNGIIKSHSTLVHVDQHSDMWKPSGYFSPSELKNPEKVFYYTNYVLNVGSFIRPALKAGIFDNVVIIDGTEGLKNSFVDEIVLDIDMDFFASEMEFVPDDLKIQKIREYINRARFITIATSPFFMNQQKAIDMIRLLFT